MYFIIPYNKNSNNVSSSLIYNGFDLICKNGYYNINTAQIASRAEVSTGIVYQYFKDKFDIFMAVLEKYGNDIFFPMLKMNNTSFVIDNLEIALKQMIDKYVKNHKISKAAHEEITAMIHSNTEVASYFYNK